MVKIDLSEFEVFVPKKLHLETVNVNPSGTISFSSKLCEKIGGKAIALYLSKDGKKMLIDPKPTSNISIRMTKARIIKAREFTQKISACGVQLPAKYDAEWIEEEEKWLCTLYMQAPVKEIEDTPKKPRKRGLSYMIEE